MIKHLTCIECPKGCRLTVEVGDNGEIKVNGNQCPKGERYASAEVQRPVRTLTTCVLGQGLALKMIPVRTDQPIPKDWVPQAMTAVKNIKINKPVQAGDVVFVNFLGLGVNLISTRSVASGPDEGKKKS